MIQYVMKQRAVKFSDAWDVIIAGGGPAGCTAAIAAAREGARTLLIEATGCLGGMGTSGLVPAWCPFSDREKIIYKGLAEKVFEEAKKGIAHIRQEDMDWVPIDPERLKRVYDDMVIGSGAHVLFNTVLSCVETDGQGNVEAVIVSNKAGLTAYKAKVYVDCTGDADLSAWAGASFHMGDDKTSDLQPATLCFAIANVNEQEYLHGPVLHGANPESPIYDILKSGNYPLIADVHFCNNLIGPSTVGFNAGHLWSVDNTDPESLSNSMIQGRKLVLQIRDALAQYHPKAFANSYLAATASLMGIRESRRIIGDYCLTTEDYLARRSFHDEICRNSYFIDIHTSQDEIQAVRNKEFSIEERFEHYKKGESHGIPYRCLTPKRLKNVLVAGRSISCDRPVQGSVRVMPVCLAMGEAAGMAAALAAIMPEPDVHAIDVHALRERLKEEGSYLPE